MAGSPEPSAQRKRATSTSSFGVSRRENHDASGFYARFVPPLIDRSTEVHGSFPIDDAFRVCDIREDPSPLPDNSVALVVTSPPYFAGKQYEEELDREGVPSTYAEYMDMLRGVFAECLRVLEPGGRMAINVANLGRKPYRSLSADVISILQNDLRMLLRGEVIWQKGDGAAGSCAWGSFRSAANPVLRDLTERVIIASKGRFDRAISVREREAHNPPLPHRNTANTDEFMAATLDLWEMAPEQAKRVGHPAPFPVALPERLIHLYTYEDDLVIDPFMGSGTTLVAAAKLSRRYVGYDLDSSYREIAQERVRAALTVAVEHHPRATRAVSRRRSTLPVAAEKADDFQARASREGKAAQHLAEELLEQAGFEIVAKNARLRGLGVVVNLVARDANGQHWCFDVSGAFTTTRGGLLRTDSVWKSLGRAHVVALNRDRKDLAAAPYVLVSSHLPRPGSEGDVALRAAGSKAIYDVIEMTSVEDFNRLREYAAGGYSLEESPLPGFWRERDLI